MILVSLDNPGIDPTIDNFISINGSDYRSKYKKGTKSAVLLSKWWDFFHENVGGNISESTDEWNIIKARTYITINIRKGKLKLSYKNNCSTKNGRYFNAGIFLCHV